MTQRNRATTKTYFETGDTPTQTEFADSFDSQVFWLDDVDTDGTLAGNSDGKVPSQKAVKTYADGKVASNVAIAGATKTKITYDAKGLVTAGADATTADIADSSNKRYCTDAEKTAVGTIADKVNKSDYDAQSILQATSDNTPTALTVGEQTVIGRLTGGNISALTVAQLQALVFSLALGIDITLGENYGITLDASLSADGKYCGITEAGVAGASLAFGQLCYLNNDDGRWELADANLSDGYDKKLGICVLAGNDGDATKMLLYGKVRADAQFPALTIGAPVYMSETAGAIVTTAPTTADSATRVIGFGNSADELHFHPSPDYYTYQA